MTRPTAPALPFAVDFASIAPPTFALGAAPPTPTDDQKGDAATGKAGRTFLAGVQRRRMAGIKRAAEIVNVLPEEGESLHCILLGYFDLLNLLLAFLDRAGSPCSTLRVATLSASKRNISELAALLDRGAVKRLDFLTSCFQQEHDGDILAEALTELCDRRGQRVAAARSHCKIVTAALDDGRRYTMEGSANLRTSRNCEQVALARDAGLFAFYDTWLSETVTTHEIRPGDGIDAS